MVTATRLLSPIDAASEPPPPSAGDTKLASVMNCPPEMVDAATFPPSNELSVTADGGTDPRSTSSTSISPSASARSPDVPFGMSVVAT